MAQRKLKPSTIPTVRIYSPSSESGFIVIEEKDRKPEDLLYEDYLASLEAQKSATEETDKQEQEEEGDEEDEQERKPQKRIRRTVNKTEQDEVDE